MPICIISQVCTLTATNNESVLDCPCIFFGLLFHEKKRIPSLRPLFAALLDILVRMGVETIPAQGWRKKSQDQKGIFLCFGRVEEIVWSTFWDFQFWSARLVL